MTRPTQQHKRSLSRLSVASPRQWLVRGAAPAACFLLLAACETSSGASGETAEVRSPAVITPSASPAPAAQPPAAHDAAKQRLENRKLPDDESEQPAGGAESLSAETDADDSEQVPRVYVKTRHVWVRSMPTSEVQWIGYLWWGAAVKVRGEQRATGPGCSKDWVPIEPRGWVCVDGEQATLDPEDPQYQAILPYRPKVESAWPHRYAAVHAPLTKYGEPPDEATQRARERGYEAHFAKVKEARLTGSTAHFPDYLLPLDPSLSGRTAPRWEPLPDGLLEGQTRIVGRSAISYVDSFDVGERSFLLTGDLGWVPKDRVELLEPSQFRGVELGKDWHLPIAFFRGKDRPSFRLTEAGDFVEAEKSFERHGRVQLTSETKRVGRTTFYRIEGQDLWVSDREAVVPTPRSETPWGAPIGEKDETGRARKGRATWIEASILEGWLVAFEGTRAVYATMISAGRGGTPHPDKDPLETASTPTGWFPIGGKFKTATMESSSTPIVHADVPWTQNFSGPYAIHSAYWHDDFGNLKSAGCVNVSPRDGQWLFEFSEPDVPEDWHGVRYVSRYGGGSTLFIVH